MILRALQIVLIACLTVSLWAQVAGTEGTTAAAMDQPMETPAPVSVGGQDVSFGSELERSNYLHGGVQVEGLYDEDIFLTVPPQSDTSYTVTPYLGFDIKRSRLDWDLDYRPGFTFYQRFNSQNQSNQDLSTNLHYRISPHVTATLDDKFVKTSAYSDQLRAPDGGTSTPVFAIVPPVSDILSNTTEGQVTYQFAPNAMVGASGSFFDLHYLQISQVPGLYDSTQKGGQAFYTHRLSGKYYIGATYDFEDILASPINTETQVHGATFFLTVNFGRRITLATYGGAQYSEIFGSAILFSERLWSPTGGGTFTWQGLHTTFATSFSHRVTPGGGLATAASSYLADASLRHQFTPNFTGSIIGSYLDNKVLQTNVLYSSGGHTLSGGGTLQRRLGRNLSGEIGYTRIYENYSNIMAIQGNPGRNRAWVSISYQFERPMGR
jgi:hypothetical protein